MSFYEQRNPADITIKELLPFVQEHLGDIPTKQITFIYQGTYNVFDINNQYMLRVPDREFRNSKGLDMIKSEERMLTFLSNKLPLTIPSILFINNSIELPFVITKKIPGISLCNVLFKLSNGKKVKIAKKIGEFLNDLHSTSLLEIYLEFSSRGEDKKIMKGSLTL